MKNIPKYSNYKDSEIDWLKKIPSHWDLIRLGSEFDERREKVSDKDFEALSVTKKGIVPQLENAAKSNDGDNRKGVRKGDFVINSRSDRKGSSGIAIQDGSVSLINIVLKPKSIFPKYSEYLLKSYHFIEEYYRYGHGIVADLWTTRYSEMKAMPIPLPPLSEQTAIANFLDKKTAEIKEFIALKEKTIELLKERKMAIINELVTGKKVWNGTEWTAPTEVKDSGIEWLGKIPKDWEVKKLKYVSKIIYGISPHESTYNIEGKGKILINGPAEYSVENFGYTRAIKWTTLPVKFARKGDLLFCLRGSTTGRLNICHDDVAIGRGCAALRGEIDQDFFILAIYSLKEKIIETFKGSTFPSVTSEDLNNYSIAFCSEVKMKKIVKKANEINIEIDDLISKTQTEINLIKEYQQSLISEVVTGKVDLRNKIISE